MKNKIILSFLCSFVLIFSVISTTTFVYGENAVQYMACESTATGMCVLEGNSGRILYGKNIHKKLAMASTTKIFTALTVLEHCDNLDAKVAVDDKSVGIEGTSIYLRKNEVLTVKELLLGMMLPSGNDAATALAYYIGGDEQTFCSMMQETAQKAGAKNSQFKNAHGLDADGHYTTAYDIAKVSAEALKNPKFVDIVTTKSAVISGNKEVKSRYIKNKNRLLTSFDGCNGIKTGFTDNAGRCFVASANKDNMQIVCSVLNCGNMFEEASRLMQKAFNEFSMTEILPAYNIVSEINVKGGRKDSVKVYNEKGFSYPLTNDEKLYINFIQDVPTQIQAPFNKEEVVGKIKVYLKDSLLFEDEVKTREGIDCDSLWSYLKDVLKFWK